MKPALVCNFSLFRYFFSGFTFMLEKKVILYIQNVFPVTLSCIFYC